ncbi:hypothetical protein C8J56DRAFT_756321, partial [Mycena floridula]
FPQFHTQNCNWNAVLDMVRQPLKLWATYSPKSLGTYQSVKDLWTVWDEGTRVDGVGQMPAMRLIDERYGNVQGRRASWRPSNDTTARKLWSNFYFFIQQVQELRKGGKSVTEATSQLDNQRDGRTLNKLQSELQKPRKAKAVVSG